MKNTHAKTASAILLVLVLLLTGTPLTGVVHATESTLERSTEDLPPPTNCVIAPSSTEVEEGGLIWFIVTADNAVAIHTYIHDGVNVVPDTYILFPGEGWWIAFTWAGTYTVCAQACNSWHNPESTWATPVTITVLPKSGSVYVKLVTESGLILKDSTDVVENAAPGTPYTTSPENFPGCLFSRMLDGSAPASGTVVSGNQCVTYVYRTDETVMPGVVAKATTFIPYPYVIPGAGIRHMAKPTESTEDYIIWGVE
ncbi:MAG: MucBP domain-containing protein [Bacillota bacterium]|nr:MucBP domain-containing protein [Bacillota bacterium]